VVAVPDDPVLGVPQHRTGEDLALDVGAAAGVRAEAGVLSGPRSGVAYALIVNFDDLTIAHRLRAHDAFRVLGVELMEYVY